MEYLDQDLPETGNTSDTLQTTRQMRQSWHTISRWSLFFAIIGFVLIGLILIGLGKLSSMLPMMAYALGENPVLDAIVSMGALFTGFIVLLLAVHLFINFLQYRFAMQMKRAIAFTDQEAFEQSWLNYRNFFRAIGIVTVLSLVVTIGFLMVVYTVTR